MDIYKLRGNLGITLEHHPIEYGDILYRTIAELGLHEDDPWVIADLLIEAAYSIAWTADRKDGPHKIQDLLETHMKATTDANTSLDIRRRTKAIEESSS